MAFYERQVPGARFIFAERNLEADLRDGIKSGRDPGGRGGGREGGGPERAGPRAGTARTAPSRSTIEDHLIDPRTGAILAKTIVLVTSLGD